MRRKVKGGETDKNVDEADKTDTTARDAVRTGRRRRERIVLELKLRLNERRPGLPGTLRQHGTQVDMINERTLQHGELLEVAFAQTLRTGVDASFVVQELLRAPGLKA